MLFEKYKWFTIVELVNCEHTVILDVCHHHIHSCFLSFLAFYKYWNWCRCIQRKDSAWVILTASWFSDINIGYRFHISTVCHSCCNNVMYFSIENLDISGSAWKNIMLAWHSCWHGNYIYRARAVFAPAMQASAARLRPGSGISFMTYIDICIKYDSNKCIQYVKLDMISWYSVPSPAYVM